MKIDHQLVPHTRINSKWMKDLNMSHTIKILEENGGSKISDISCNNIFANITPKPSKIKENKKNGTTSN